MTVRCCYSKMTVLHAAACVWCSILINTNITGNYVFDPLNIRADKIVLIAAPVFLDTEMM
jgi:hypothetical protein